MDNGPRRLRALLIGSGSLGRAFLRRLRDRGGPIELVGVMTAHHGRIAAPDGLDPSLAVNLAESDGFGDDAPKELEAMLETCKAEAIIECIPQNIRSGDPALSFMRTALDKGVHVITSNKAPIVLGYRDLQHRAVRSKAQFRFEATVLDGLPLFSFLSRLGGQTKVRRIRGVLNATSSVVLESVGLGSTRSRGLARAQAQGIAEADAVLDLDGWDAAAKAALLANVWMDGALRVVDVARTGCDALKDDKIRAAGEEGLHYRLVAVVERSADDNIRASVEPVAISAEDPLYALHGAQGGVTIETDAGHALTFLQQTSGSDDAAFGIIQDAWGILNGAPQV